MTAVLMGVAASAACGLLNGLLIAGLRITLIVTLGTMSIMRGAAKGLASRGCRSVGARRVDGDRFTGKRVDGSFPGRGWPLRCSRP